VLSCCRILPLVPFLQNVDLTTLLCGIATLSTVGNSSLSAKGIAYSLTQLKPLKLVSMNEKLKLLP
jgi:hypothetical protein